MNERSQGIEEYKVELDHMKQLVLLMDDIFEDLGKELFEFEREKDKDSRMRLAFTVAYSLNRVYDRINTLNSIQLDKVIELTNGIDSELKSLKN